MKVDGVKKGREQLGEFKTYLKKNRRPVSDDNTYTGEDVGNRLLGDYPVPTLFNGNFDVVTAEFDPTASIPGWSVKGDSGEVSVASTTPAPIENLVDWKNIPSLNTPINPRDRRSSYLELIGVDRNDPNYHNYATKLDKNFLKITKDPFVIPEWGALNFNLHVPPGTNDANLKGSVKVTIQSEDIPDHTFTVNLAKAEGNTGTYESDTHRLGYATVGFETFTTNIPDAFRGQVATVTFELENPSDETTVYVDDIKAKSVHLKFGNNPKGEAKKEARYEDKPYSENKFAENLLVERPQYTLSYNGTTKTANWASWQMNKSWNFAVPTDGGIQRRDGYQDNTLPQGFTSGVTPGIYDNAQVDGVVYNQGHLTPHRERQRTQKDATAVGLLSNIVPQQENNNQREWARIEEYVKRLVNTEGKEVYIIAGTDKIKKDAEGNNLKLPETNGVVDIPANLWKVMLVLDSPGQGVADVTTNNYAVGFYLENRQYTQPGKGQKVKLNDHVKTVNEIEALTGYDFFSNIPSDIQETIENKIVRFDDNNRPIEIIG